MAGHSPAVYGQMKLSETKEPRFNFQAAFRAFVFTLPFPPKKTKTPT